MIVRVLQVCQILRCGLQLPGRSVRRWRLDFMWLPPLQWLPPMRWLPLMRWRGQQRLRRILIGWALLRPTRMLWKWSRHALPFFLELQLLQ